MKNQDRASAAKAEPKPDSELLENLELLRFWSDPELGRDDAPVDLITDLDDVEAHEQEEK